MKNIFMSEFVMYLLSSAIGFSMGIIVNVNIDSLVKSLNESENGIPDDGTRVGISFTPKRTFVCILSSILYGMYAVKFGMTLTALGFCIFSSALICVIFIDAQFMIIPDRCNVAILGCGILMMFENELPISDRIFGFFSVSLLFLLIVIFSGGRAMGLGDVKLMAVCGLCLGWKNILLAMFIGALCGALISGTKYIILRMRGEEATNVTPFGPYLAFGILLISYFGDNMLTWYVRMFV